MGGTYHVVCRDCEFEGLYGSVSDAETESETHRDEHGHRVTMLEIDRPDPRTRA